MSEEVKSRKISPTMFGGVLAAIVCALVLGWFAINRFDYAPLYADLPISDAALVVAELDRHETRYKVAKGGTEILVPAAQVNDVRLALYNADGPTRGLSGFELFNESEMGLTDFAQKIKFQRAIQGELSRTIMMLEGVQRARVHIALPERTVFRSQYVPPTAAVTLNMKDGYPASDETVSGVQRLVASSVPNLDIRYVDVMNSDGHIISVTPPPAYTPEPNKGYSNKARTVTASYETETAQTAQLRQYPRLAPHRVAAAVVETPAQPELKATEPEAAELETVQTAALDTPVSDASTPTTISDAPLAMVSPMATSQRITTNALSPTYAGLSPIILGLLLMALLLVTIVGFFIWQRRTYLSSDERKAFAHELSAHLAKLEDEGMDFAR